MDDIALNRLVVLECAYAHLLQRMEALEARIAEIDAAARLNATAQVVAIVKRVMNDHWDDVGQDALQRVLYLMEHNEDDPA